MIEHIGGNYYLDDLREGPYGSPALVDIDGKEHMKSEYDRLIDIINETLSDYFKSASPNENGLRNAIDLGYAKFLRNGTSIT